MPMALETDLPAWVLPRPLWVPFLTPHLMRLPGLNPMPMEDWISPGPDLPAQMAERDRLLRARPREVLGCLPEGKAAVDESLSQLCDRLDRHPGWQMGDSHLTRPDGGRIGIDRAHPLRTICRMVPEDLCLLVRRGTYRLVAATLCFPAHWRLAEKLGGSLSAIHAPVPHYDDNVAARVDRVFEAIRPEAPLYRINWAVVTRPDLFTPYPALDRIKPAGHQMPIFLRIERQTFVRLPKTEAVVFGIRTSLSPLSGLTPVQAAGLLRAVLDHSGPMVAYKGGDAFFHILRERLERAAGA